MAELRCDPGLDAAGIGVTAKDGVITLAGTVDTYPQKFAAERAVERVADVWAIADELMVVLPGMHYRDDTDVAACLPVRVSHRQPSWTRPPMPSKPVDAQLD
jgi:hypothetical protein